MRRYKLLIAGLLMVGAGAYLIFTNPQSFPLWFVWLAGPFLWYIGIAVTIGGIGTALFLPLSRREKQDFLEKERKKNELPVLHMQKFATQAAPAGLLREIPAMGGFLM